MFFYKGHEAPLLVILLILAGGMLAFCMEMSGMFLDSLFYLVFLSEYLLLVNTSGITLNIFGIVKVILICQKEMAS